MYLTLTAAARNRTTGARFAPMMEIFRTRRAVTAAHSALVHARFRSDFQIAADPLRTENTSTHQL